MLEELLLRKGECASVPGEELDGCGRTEGRKIAWLGAIRMREEPLWPAA